LTQLVVVFIISKLLATIENKNMVVYPETFIKVQPELGRNVRPDLQDNSAAASTWNTVPALFQVVG